MDEAQGMGRVETRDELTIDIPAHSLIDGLVVAGRQGRHMPDLLMFPAVGQELLMATGVAYPAMSAVPTCDAPRKWTKPNSHHGIS